MTRKLEIAFDIRDFAMLNVISSKMNTKEEMTVMHILWMIAFSQWGYRDWNVEGYRRVAPPSLSVGWNTVNEAIIAMMNIVPKFKTDNNLQKVHSVFLTDGAGNSLRGKNEWQLITLRVMRIMVSTTWVYRGQVKTR